MRCAIHKKEQFGSDFALINDVVKGLEHLGLQVLAEHSYEVLVKLSQERNCFEHVFEVQMHNLLHQRLRQQLLELVEVHCCILRLSSSLVSIKHFNFVD